MFFSVVLVCETSGLADTVISSNINSLSISLPPYYSGYCRCRNSAHCGLNLELPKVRLFVCCCCFVVVVVVVVFVLFVLGGEWAGEECEEPVL